MSRQLIISSLFLLAIVLSLHQRVDAHPATGIVVDSKGNVYFSDLETIWRVETSGKLTVFRSGIRGRHVHELTVDSEDNIFGADLSYESQKWIGAVWKMTPKGVLTYLSPPTSDAPRGRSLWQDRQGNTYWVDQNNHTKTRTLLLRRTPEGAVTTLAGGAWGHADGKGIEARFGSIGGMTVAADGNIYLTDGDSLRRVTLDGIVTTLARDLTTRTSEDSPTLFGGNHGGLAGLSVGPDGTAFVVDSGNRRLLKIREGKTQVVVRSEPPFFPTGAAITPTGDVYILEVGLTLPNISSGPRVRKLTTDGKTIVIATVGENRSERGTAAIASEKAGIAAESMLQFFYDGRAAKYILLATVTGLIAAFIWRRRRKERRA
jgi:sugar lactone lactonase YvrE